MLTRRALLAGAGGFAAGAIAGTAEAKPPLGRGPKPKPRNHVKTFSDGVGLREYSIIVGPPGGGAPDFPDATNTGVPAGTNLTAYTGPSTITTNNTTVDSKLITDCIVIDADDVTFTKCKFQSNGCFWNLLNDSGAGLRLRIEDCEFDAQDNLGADACINVSDCTMLRCNLHGAPDVMKFNGSNSLIQDCYLHDPIIGGEDPHGDGMQTLGATNVTIRHNTIIMTDLDATSCIIMGEDGIDLRNITIENNLVGGANVCIYGGYEDGVSDPDFVSNIQVINNWVTTQVVSTGSGSGIIFTACDPPIVTLSGNRWYDGPNAGNLI